MQQCEAVFTSNSSLLLQAYQLTFGSDVTENGGYAQSALLQLFWEIA